MDRQKLFLGSIMPALKGLMSYMRFYVNVEHPIDANFIKEQLSLFRFREGFGWVPFLYEYDDEKSIELSDIIYDDKIVFSLRIDTIKLPKEILKVAVKKSIDRYKKDHNKWPDKTVKKEIELAESNALKARIIPNTKIIETVWCLKSNQVRIFSRSSKALDKFVEYFEQTFSLKLNKCDFAWFSLKLKNNLDHFDDLIALKAKPLFNPPIRTDIN